VGKNNLFFVFAPFLAIGCVGAEPTSQTATAPAASAPADAAAAYVSLQVAAPSSVVSGTRATIGASAIDALGNKIDVTGHVTWTTTDLLSASATGDTLYGIGIGKVRLTATLGELLSASAEVEVVDATLESLSLALDAGSDTARTGALTTWRVTGHYNDGSTADVTTSAAWSTSDPSVALVQQAGQIYAVKEGMATVTASLAGQVASAPLMIANPTLIELRIDAPASAMPSDASEQLTATGVYSDGSTTDMTAQVGWYTSDGSLATVWQGQVQALSSGVVTITAAHGDLRGAIDLTLSE
jgi:hypothetical protein